jgi:hypothetical protein
VLHGLGQKSLKNYDIQQHKVHGHMVATQIPPPPHNKWPPLPYNPIIYKHCYKKPGKSRTCLSKHSETPSMWGNSMQPCSQDMKSVQFLNYHDLLLNLLREIVKSSSKESFSYTISCL